MIPTIVIPESREAWLPISGYENYYSVSTLGRVRREKTNNKKYSDYKENKSFWCEKQKGCCKKIWCISYCYLKDFV